MSNFSRLDAIQKIAEMRDAMPKAAMPADIDFYGEDVFNEAVIRKYLSKAMAEKLLSTMRGERPFEPTIAPAVARAMKEWAMSRGATHFTHWFQPLTCGTAEKHDAFLERDKAGNPMMELSGKSLIVGEPDASSFPSGGLRSTFEARGYTAWDPTSPAFIKRHANGATLCIPTAFCSYTGEVLDRKTPVLRSMQALGKSVVRLMACFGQSPKHTQVTMGPEQEYFLVDKGFYYQRPDLVQTGRTLFGAAPAKHQQLEDHYFGAIKPRILAFMNEVEDELWRLGIPAKTRHNEVAPSQFELAPLFEELNLAIDHNMLTMQVLREVAERHGLVCLLHEKPYAGINGSGKHNNWSVTYGGKNLLDPGDTPQENAVFLTMLTAVIRAVNLHADLLRSATASAGNDHRLGANEAPPAILSIFLGEQLTDVIDALMDGKSKKNTQARQMMVGVDALPTLPRDATDRNRTSPFAFTGNKFEFRSVGSSQSCSDVNVVLNTIVAESLDYLSERLEKLPKAKFNSGLQSLLKEVISANRRIIFNGDGYTAAWQKEAAKRGLPNLRTTLEALQPLKDKKNQAIFAKYGVFVGKELDSRYEVFKDEYERKILIEGKIALKIARESIEPVVSAQLLELAKIVKTAKSIGMKAGVPALAKNANRLGEYYSQLDEGIEVLAQAVEANAMSAIVEALAKLRKVVDALECLVDDAKWPLPKYREMLFIY
ncbi:MAG: glutamine synthetase III [Victivallales bacterium]|nr:glutamine synthetase III [Victivallales bacterium]